MLHWALIGIMALILAAGGDAPGDAQTLPRWQYRVLSKQQLLKLGEKDLAAGLNQLGKQGWELVGIDDGYVFKRRGPTGETSIAELKGRVAEADRDVEAQREHLAFSQLMARKGLVSEAFMQTEHKIMQQAEAAAEQARRDLDARLVPAPKKVPAPARGK